MSLFDLPEPSQSSRPPPASYPPRPPTPWPTTKKPMEQWMITRLEQAGHIDATTGATRNARTVFCGTCRQAVMRGLTDPPAIPADANPEPLSAVGEILALLAGALTYELRWQGDHYELDRRDQWRIVERPAGTTQGVDVLAEHICGEHAAWPTAETLLNDWQHNPNTASLQPPF